METLFLPCTYLTACCSFSSRGCVPFPSYIWWCYNLSCSVAFLTALLSLCCRVQSCSVRHLGLGQLQANWFCHCLSAAQAAGKLCVVLGEVQTAKEVTFTDPVYTRCTLHMRYNVHAPKEPHRRDLNGRPGFPCKKLQ